MVLPLPHLLRLKHKHIDRDFEGNITRYVLSDPKDHAKTVEVPADWFERHKEELRIREGESWSVVGKPTLEIPASHESDRKVGTVVLGSAEESREDANAEVAQLESELSQLYKSIPESDQVPVWRYAASISDEERSRRLPDISENVRHSGIHLKYLGLFERVREARKRAQK